MDLQFPDIPTVDEDELPDWVYKKRREMQEILPGVYLGPYAAAMKSKLQSLQADGITHIVCIRQDVEAHLIKPNFPDHFNYLVLEVADSMTENIIRHFPKVKEFIDGCLEHGGRVLVHGNAGMSRSAALVIAYVMETYGINYRDALKHVQQRRFCISPNESFANQLTEYEPILKARLQVSHQQQQLLQAVTTGSKRRIDDVDSEMEDESNGQMHH